MMNFRSENKFCVVGLRDDDYTAQTDRHAGNSVKTPDFTKALLNCKECLP